MKRIKIAAGIIHTHTHTHSISFISSITSRYADRSNEVVKEGRLISDTATLRIGYVAPRVKMAVVDQKFIV
jgi:hypothetical protein